jgi:hypothetical protein
MRHFKPGMASKQPIADTSHMGRSLKLSILTCLAGLLLVTACSSEPVYDEGYGPVSAPAQDCDPAMSGYPGCDEGPYQESDDYYPDYGGAYYPGTGVVVVPELVPGPVPVPVPQPRPRQLPPPKHRHPPERVCHPQPGRPCP